MPSFLTAPLPPRTETQALSSLWFVSGTFGVDSGRPSGYALKLFEALRRALPPYWKLSHTNGGAYPELAQMAAHGQRTDVLLWFANIPNELPKLIPLLRKRSPAAVLVISKNNRAGKYGLPDLRERLIHARAELLVEFREAGSAIGARLHSASRFDALPLSTNIPDLAAALASELDRIQALASPITQRLEPTEDADSWRAHDLMLETGLPEAPHPGGFGAVRKNHVHEGVDLYVPEGTLVRTMEAGTVLWRGWFTGERAGSPWWRNTEAVLVAGDSGGLNYGELNLLPAVRPGAYLAKGSVLGAVTPVLKTDKGRPGTMLHLERYAHGIDRPVCEWALHAPRPEGLIDPTPLLRAAGVRA